VTGPALSAALAGGDVAAAIIPAGAPARRALVAAAQEADVAGLLEREVHAGGPAPWPLAEGADGLHVAGEFEARLAAVEGRPEGATVGAVANGRHEAMVLGEAGADYVWFGSTVAVEEDRIIDAAWWQALFEVPAIVAGPCESEAIDSLIATQVEFIAVDVFSGNAAPVDSVAGINARLDRRTVHS